MDNLLGDFVDGLRDRRDEASLREHIARFTISIAVRYFSYYWVPLLGARRAIPRDANVPSFAISGFPVAWREYYRAQSCRGRDPVLRQGLRTSLPFSWSELDGCIALTDAEKSLMAEAYDHGLSCGLTVPIHGFGGDFAVLTFASDEDGHGFYRAVKKLDHILHVAALHFHEAVKKTLNPAGTLPNVRRLTSREIDVLLWINDGKSYWEISGILGISKHTVESHVRNAMRKLEVNTSRHAAAIVAQLPLERMENPRASRAQNLPL